MSFLLIGAGLVLIALPSGSARWGRRLEPAEWARLAGLAAGAGFLALRLGLLLAALPVVSRAVGLHAVADACHRMLPPLTSGGPVIGWASAIASMAIALRTYRARRCARRAMAVLRVEQWFGQHRVQDGIDVVTLPSNEVLAYAVMGQPAQVVVTDGLTNALTGDETTAVVRHELSHLWHRHHRWLGLASTVDASLGWLPPVRSTSRVLRTAIERWADEEAAAAPDGRPAVRRALAKVTATMLTAAPAFTAADTVIERLDALKADPPAPPLGVRLVAAAPLLTGVLLTAGVAVAWISYTHHGLLGIIGYCPA